MNNTSVNQILIDCKNDLLRVKTIIDGLGLSSNIVPYLTKYSIIRSCGTIETAYKSLVVDYCEKRVKIQVKTFLNKRVRDSSSNPTYSNICKLLGNFDENWKESLKSQIDSLSHKSRLLASLQSLVDARNDFAHGGNPSATMQSVIDYFDDSNEIIEIIDRIIG